MRTALRLAAVALLQQGLRLGDVLVAAAGQADEDRAVRLCLGELQRMRERVGGFERAEDAFALGQRLERGERLGVGRADILRAAAVLEMRVLRADRGIIEAGRDRPAYR